ncbi:MAG: hypothetical protein NTY19_23975 [Planctomycetota bacterium]|nr:hypothetical protein [Planctomycetota bacterium]
MSWSLVTDNWCAGSRLMSVTLGQPDGASQVLAVRDMCKHFGDTCRRSRTSCSQVGGDGARCSLVNNT